MIRVLFFSLFFLLPLYGIEYTELTKALGVGETPLIHDELNLAAIKGASENEEVTICCHGYSGDYQFGYALKNSGLLSSHVVTFNFPDFGPSVVHKDPNALAFGTIEELLPLIYVMKECVTSADQNKIHLYGWSAGGGAIVNALAVLANGLYQEHLRMIGIDESCKNKILSAIERGNIVLDCPLKSIDEIVADRGLSPQLKATLQQSLQNKLRPIDNLQALDDLSLNILVHFQPEDEVLSNRDDALFIDRIKKANRGNTFVVMGAEGGHNCLQPSLKMACKHFFKG